MFTGDQQRRLTIYKRAFLASLALTAAGLVACGFAGAAWYWWAASFLPPIVASIGVWAAMKTIKDLW